VACEAVRRAPALPIAVRYQTGSAAQEEELAWRACVQRVAEFHRRIDAMKQWCKYTC